jgi:hypothetical protein
VWGGGRRGRWIKWGQRAKSDRRATREGDDFEPYVIHNVALLAASFEQRLKGVAHTQHFRLQLEKEKEERRREERRGEERVKRVKRVEERVKRG